MNAKFFSLGALSFVLLTGCESLRYSAPPVFPDSTPMPLPEAKIPPTTNEVLARAATQPIKPFESEGWRDLFDGKSLWGWRVTDFKQGGSVAVSNGLLVFNRGEPFVGVNCTNEIPTVNYEIAFDAMRVAGDDFFCGLTFPVRDSHCSLIVGGWGGGIVGLSNLDGGDASENETTQYMSIETGRWYRIRLRVTEQKIEAWIEQKRIVNLNTTGRKLSVRFGEIEMSKPFGLTAWNTSAAFRAMKIRAVSGPAEEPQ